MLGSARADRAPIFIDADRRRMSVMAGHSPAGREAQANVRLASMAPELARTVIEQAEQLARFRQWAQSLCEATTCAETLARHGRHAPNCPVADLGLEQTNPRG